MRWNRQLDGALLSLVLLGLVGCSSSASSGSPDAGGATQPDAGSVTQALPSRTGPGTFVLHGRQETGIEVVVPSPLPANPPLIISFHSTGGDQSEGIAQFDLAANGPKVGAVVIAPRAGYRDGNHPADVDHELNQTGSSWNMWAADASTNEDLRYVLALIASANASYGVDVSRVYTMGFSNGAFMAYFVAASLPDAIAGFAENSGGWTTDSCPTRYGADSAGLSFIWQGTAAPGAQIACSTLYASTNPTFPSQCTPNAQNHLRPPVLAGRVPFGFLAHYTNDDTVSVQWSCFLGGVLGERARLSIRVSDNGEGARGHGVQPDFFDNAWTFFAGRTRTQ